VFLQIGDENLHIVRSLLDEIFGAVNFVALIQFSKTSSATSDLLAGVADYVLWYAKSKSAAKYHGLFRRKRPGEVGASKYDAVEDRAGNRRLLTESESNNPNEIPEGFRIFTVDQLTSQRRFWKTSIQGLKRLSASNRIVKAGNRIRYVRYLDDFAVFALNNVWTDTGSVQSRSEPNV
jgi:adenine-specific DNA-methyltransferase